MCHHMENILDGVDFAYWRAINVIDEATQLHSYRRAQTIRPPGRFLLENLFIVVQQARATCSQMMQCIRALISAIDFANRYLLDCISRKFHKEGRKTRNQDNTFYMSVFKLYTATVQQQMFAVT